jgi:magnesium-transporting ATPase (P-type)
MSVFSGFYVSNYSKLTTDGLRRKAEYIFYTELSPIVRAENGTATDSQTISYNATAEGFMTYGVYFILMNTIIPVSLVVSIEIIKLVQGPFFSTDVEMYDPISMKQCQPLSMTLHEEMASIDYIFADKTGTLTANVMQFKACTVGSVCYDQDYKDEDYEYEMGDSEAGFSPNL